MHATDDEQRVPRVLRVVAPIALNLPSHVFIAVHLMFRPVLALVDFLPRARHVRQHDAQPLGFGEDLVDFPNRLAELEGRLIGPPEFMHIPQHVDDRCRIIFRRGEKAVHQRLIVARQLQVDDTSMLCEFRRSHQGGVERPVTLAVVDFAEDDHPMLHQRPQEELLRVRRFALEKLDERAQMLFGICNRRPGIAESHGGDGAGADVRATWAVPP